MTDNTKRIVNKSLLDDIADAIREQDGTSADIVASTFPARIRNLPKPTGTLSISENGTYNVSDYENVIVSVEGGGKMYKHECYAFNVYFKVKILKTIYTSSPTPITAYDFDTYIYPTNSRCALGGTIKVSSLEYPLIYCDVGNIYYLKDGSLASVNRLSSSAIDAFYDTVTEV